MHVPMLSSTLLLMLASSPIAGATLMEMVPAATDAQTSTPQVIQVSGAAPDADGHLSSLVTETRAQTDAFVFLMVVRRRCGTLISVNC